MATIAAQLGEGRLSRKIAPEFMPLTLATDHRALRAALLQVLGRVCPGDVGCRLDRPRPLRTADFLAIVVGNEGADLPAKDLSSATPDDSRGRGFGLVLARSLHAAHGGTLRLEALPGSGPVPGSPLPLERLAAG